MEQIRFNWPNAEGGACGRLFRSFIAAAITVFTAAAMTACGGSDTPAAEPPSEASATIGAAGGTLDGPDGVKLVVPAGALTQDTLIRIARTGVGAPALPADYASSTPIYEFTPHGLSFRLPVTISMPYVAPAGAAHADVFMASPGEDWQAMQATVSDGVATWSRLSFSWATGSVCAIPVGNTDPYRCIWPFMAAPLSANPATALVLERGGYRDDQSSLNAAATLTFKLMYSAPPDCLGARIRIIRKNNDVGPVLVLRDEPVGLAPGGGVSGLHKGSTTHDVSMSHADNGSVWFGLSFSCARAGQTRSTDGAAHTIAVAIPATAAPVVTQQPANVAVVEPANATFTAAANGAPAPTVQWQASIDGGATWSDVAGATALSYATPPTTVGQSGTQYRAVFTNSQGQVASAAASLIVTLPQATPAFSTQPVNQSVAVGATATFNAVVSGTPAPGLQWQVSTDGGATWSDLAGATAAAYTTPSTALGDNGKRYRAVATNSAGSVASSAAVLTVTAAPQVRAASQKVAAAFRHTCAIKSDATLSCWGYNSSGQLGSGDRNSYLSPHPVAGLTDVSAVATGSDWTCAIHNGSNLSCWGNNVLRPALVAGQPVVSALAVGSGHYCFVWAGYVSCVGGNQSGQLGNGTTTPSATPVGVFSAGNAGRIDNVVALSAGPNHTCALIADGSALCWGLLPGLATPSQQAVPLPGVINAVSIALGAGGPCVALADGTVQCWSRTSLRMEAVTGLSGVTSVVVGSQHACAVLGDTRVKCWGTGLMGNGNVSETQPTPQIVNGLSGVTELAAGFQHTCALLSNRSMVCWGANGEGQLGDGNSAGSTVPTALLGGATFGGP
jgi:alpha-tubulin suppressor-like RCC1 family protein